MKLIYCLRMIQKMFERNQQLYFHISKVINFFQVDIIGENVCLEDFKIIKLLGRGSFGKVIFNDIFNPGLSSTKEE